MKECAARITDIDAVDVRRAGDALAQHCHLVVHALRRRHEKGIGDGCDEADERGGVPGEGAEPIDQAADEGIHIVFGTGDRSAACAAVVKPHQRRGHDDEHSNHHETEQRPQ